MTSQPNSIFENLPLYLTVDEVVAITRASKATVFDWNYRKGKYGIPDGMFHKRGRRLLVCRQKFQEWFFSRTS